MPVSQARAWTGAEIQQAILLYCQLTFGKLHQRQPDVIALAHKLQRTPSSIAMKLVNLASLDPAIRLSGRAGLGNASKLDQEVWNQFMADWDGTISHSIKSDYLEDQKAEPLFNESLNEPAINEPLAPASFIGETKQVMMTQRVKQSFFRKMILASYDSKCCMSGVPIPQLLIASHIIPWSKDAANRLNPSNGLCLSALHDRAFDQGFISLNDSFEVCISPELKKKADVFTQQSLISLEGKTIKMPDRFLPSTSCIQWHRANVFRN